MTTAPSLSHLPGYYDENARSYLQSLQQGQRPDIRPEFGRWEPVVSFFEHRLKTVERPESIAPHLFKSVLKSGKFPGLDELLSGVSRQAAPGQSLIESEHLDVPTLPVYAQLPAALAEGACPELDWYEAFSRKASDRAYDQYHQFCGLWLFSVVAGRRVSLEIKQKKFYTNLMLSLCGATSFYAKSFTANIARKMLYELNMGYTLAPNRITPQKLLSDMAGGHVPTNFSELELEKQDRIRRRLGMPGQKGLLFDELGLFIQDMLRKNSTNAHFADLLMTLDECPPEYEASTIARGGEPIEKPYLTLLGCMTPTNLKQNAKSGAEFWNDGFWARFSFVVAPPPPKDQDDPGPPQVSEFDDLELPFPPALLESLREWHERLGIPVCHLEPKMKGDKIVDGFTIFRAPLPETACTISLEARQAWVNYEHALRQLCLKFPHEDFNGSYVRLAETAMRIAVLLASLSNNNHIELRHWAKAQELTEILRANLHELYAQVNVNEIANTLSRTVEDKILQCVERQCAKGAPPNLRDLTRYIKGPSSGMLKTAVIDLVRVELLKEEKVGKTTRYFIAEPDG